MDKLPGESKKSMRYNKPVEIAKKDVGLLQEKVGLAVAGSPSKNHDGPPPGLKGQALGLWFREHQVKMHEKKVVKLPHEKCKEIEALLLNVDPVENYSSDKKLMKDGVFKKKFLDKIRGTFDETMTKHLADEVIGPDPVMDMEMKKRLEEKLHSTPSNKMLEFRKKLPCYEKKGDILRVISNQQLVILSGEIGCGKTTQVAQYILDEAINEGRGSQCNIVCTQLREISAISVAERVAAERDERLGDTIGFEIRTEKVLPKKNRGSIVFVTIDILLQWIHSNPTLNGFSHLLIDEVNERDILCDFVITCLKQIIVKTPHLKVLLMSGTVNAKRFSEYFGKARCIHIPGFSFPVEEIHLDKVLTLTNFKFEESTSGRPKTGKSRNLENPDFDHDIVSYVRKLQSKGEISKELAAQLSNPKSEKLNLNLIEALIRYICENEGKGAILVFVPGPSEIQKIYSQLLSLEFFNRSKFLIIPLHSMMSTAKQKQIFSQPPFGARKIIIATNIAETITIDDVAFVIDSGYIEMRNFNMELNMTSVDYQWVSLANARRRSGCSGRVQPGKSYKLYTAARENLLKQFLQPEMQRIRLEEVVLQVKMLQLGKVAPFFETAMDPPDKKTVKLSLRVLRSLNALDAEERLTPLGFHLAQLPLDPQTAKMILMAAIFGCVDPVLSIVASLNFIDPFMTPIGQDTWLVRNKKKYLAYREKSDHNVLCNAIRKWEMACIKQENRVFAHDHFLSEDTLSLLKDLKDQFARYLHDINFLKSPDPKDKNGNVNSRNVELIKTVVCSGLYPNIAMIKDMRTKCPIPIVILKTAQHPLVELNPESICFQVFSFESPFLAYHLMTKSSAVYLNDATVVSPLALLLFGERFHVMELNKTYGIHVDDLITLKCCKKTAMLIQKLRGQLDWILANAISNPGEIWKKNTKESIALRAIIELINANNE